MFETMRGLCSDSWEGAKPVLLGGDGMLCPPDRNGHDSAELGLLGAINGSTTAHRLILRNSSLDLNAQKSLCELLAKKLSLNGVEFHNVRCDAGKMIPIPVELFRNECLSELHISRCVLSSTACKALAMRIESADDPTSLSSLTLTNVEFLDDNDKRSANAIAMLASALSSTKTVKVLKLSNLLVSDGDKMLLLKGLAWNAGHSLSVVHVEDMSLNEAHAPWLARLLAKHSPQLHELSLRKNDLNSKAVELIVNRGLCYNSTLRRLNLSENPVGDIGAARLASFLKVNASLQELKLVDCEIWRPGCLDLASAMPSFPGLTRMSLDGNDIEDCLDLLVDVIKVNFHMVHLLDSLPRMLNLERRKRRPHGRSAAVCGQYHVLDFYLRMNRARRRFLVEPILPSLLPNLFADQGANKDPSILYHFLRRSPSWLA